MNRITTHKSCLNLATWSEEGTYALGPGKRFALWTQGCLKRCQGCVSPEFQDLKPAHLVEVDALISWLSTRMDFEGITISGGEPFLQATHLAQFLQQIRLNREDLTVIVFTGFRLEELDWPEAQGFLQWIDLLIDGVFVEEQTSEVGLRGSDNQRFHYLTERLLPWKTEIEQGERIREIQYINQTIFPIGIPPKAGILGDLFTNSIDV